MDTYETNERFREYVDKICKKHEITVEEALKWYIVKEIEKVYKEKNNAR